jgi:hypothetical protein
MRSPAIGPFDTFFMRIRVTISLAPIFVSGGVTSTTASPRTGATSFRGASCPATPALVDTPAATAIAAINELTRIMN